MQIYGTPAENLCGKQVEQLREFVKVHFSELQDAGYNPYYIPEKNIYP